MEITKCPVCGSARIKRVLHGVDGDGERHSFHCPKCKLLFSIKVAVPAICYHCARPLLDKPSLYIGKDREGKKIFRHDKCKPKGGAI